MTQPSIIVVDDEADLCELIADYLSRHGFEVRTAAGGRDLDARLTERQADALILDVNMPGESGHAIAARVRAGSPMPILMLTSEAGVAGRVTALDGGVDDYLVKPFDLRELRARVGSILRRVARPTGAPPPPLGPTRRHIAFGSVALDLESHCLVRPDGAELPLTAMEFDMLQAFAENPNRVLSRDRLLDLAHRSDRDPFDRSIDIRVTRLRRKVEVDPAKPAVIRTVRGTGYMFVPPKKGQPHQN